MKTLWAFLSSLSVGAVVLTGCGVVLGDYQSRSSGATGGDGDSGPSSSLVCEGGNCDCDLNGYFGLLVGVKISWGTTPTLSASSGVDTKFWLKMRRQQTATQLVDTAVLCGLDFPDLHSNAALGETWGIRFSDDVWDANALAPFNVNGTVSGLNPGAHYTSPPFAALVGLTMSNPETAAWPTQPSGISAVDVEGDGKPGITVAAKTGPVPNSSQSYKDFPVDATNRADKLYLAFRLVVSLDGALDNCDQLSGTVAVATINNKVAIDEHILGCHLNGTSTPPNSDCSAAQSEFVDVNEPTITVDPNSQFISRRMPQGKDATCANVRELLP